MIEQPDNEKPFDAGADPRTIPASLLEGLVDSVARRAAEDRSKCLESEYAKGRASAFEAIHDELTQLITVHSGHKERSNG